MLDWTAIGAAAAQVVTIGKDATGIADWLENRLAEKPEAERPPRGVPNLPDRRPFLSNAPRGLDRPLIGRLGELAAIDDALLHPNGNFAITSAAQQAAPRTAAASLTGQGGVGKTTLALAYATIQSRRDRFEGVWVIPAEKPETIAASMAELGARLGAARPDGMPDPAYARMVWDEVAKPGHAWLIVYDNAPDYQALRPHLPPDLPCLRVLTTCRDRRWPIAFARLEVDVMEPVEATALLLQTAWQDIGDGLTEDQADEMFPPDEAAALAHELGHLPLALVVAGSYARETQTRFKELGERIADLLTAMPPSEYPQEIGAVLDLSLEAVEADKRTGRDELALLNVLPWLAPEGIDAKLVLDILQTERSSELLEDLPDDLRALSADPARLQAAFTALARRSLATATGEGAERVLALHRITAEVLRARADSPAESRAAAAAVVAASYPNDANSHTEWPEYRRLDPHVLALEWAIEVAHTSAAVEYLFNESSIYHQQQAETMVALRHGQLSVALKVKRLGADHPEVSIARNTLAGALAKDGCWAEAAREFRESLRIAELLGDSYPFLGQRYSNLAAALAGQARAEIAQNLLPAAKAQEILDLQRKAYRFQRSIAGRSVGADVSTLIILANIAETHRQVGDVRRALRYGRLAVREWGKRGGPKNLYFATTIYNLGSCELLAGRPAAGMPFLIEALDLLTASFPDAQAAPRHPHRIDAARNLARCHFALGDPDNRAKALALCADYGFDPTELEADANQFRAR